MGQNYSGMVAADTQIDRNYDSTNTDLSLSQTPDGDLDQNYSNIVAPDDQLTYRDLYLNAISGGGMPEGYPVETKELYNDTVNVPSGEQAVPLNISNDNFNNWTVTINGEVAPRTMIDGFPAYGWTDDDYIGVVDATAYSEGVLFVSDIKDTDFTLVITQTVTDPDFVQGVKSSLETLDYPFDEQKVKYNTTVIITNEDYNGVPVDAISADDTLARCSVYINDIEASRVEEGDDIRYMAMSDDSVMMLATDGEGWFFVALTTPDYEPAVGDYTIKVIQPDLNSRFNDGVNAVLSEYNLATPTVMKYEGDLTLTENDATVYIPFAQGTDLSDYEQWTVTVDGQELAWSGFDKTFFYEDSDSGVEYGVGDYMDDGYWSMSVRDSNHQTIPGTYHLVIKIAGHANVSSSVEVVTITYSDGVADKTFAELKNAYDNGKAIFANVVDDMGYNIGVVPLQYYDGGGR